MNAEESPRVPGSVGPRQEKAAPKDCTACANRARGAIGRRETGRFLKVSGGSLEVRAGIEPTYEALQASA